MGHFLTPEQIGILQEAHHASVGRKQADRIKTILFLNEGFNYAQTARLLLLDEGTIRRYEKEYKKTGIDGLLENRYHGSERLLTTRQETELTEHLKEHTYQTVKAVCAYVAKSYKAKYSIEGMTYALHRLGFVYKKTKALPGKVNHAKQEEFKTTYQHLKQSKQSEDKIYFLDATHPQHNNMPFCGWIYKGVTRTIKTNTGRGRLNVNGAVNLEEMDITVLAEETINRYAMMRLILALEEKQPAGEIYLIVDNASYNHSYELALFVQDHPRVHLIFLPPYSPNLNIIERLWKFFHEKHRDTYFEKFKEFEKAVLFFFENIHQYDEELKQRLTDSFQTLPAF